MWFGRSAGGWRGMAEDQPASDYRLQNIPPDLWRQVKARAEGEGRSIRFVVLRLLEVYAEHGFWVVETFASGGQRK
jgi:hypothetical protein